MTLATSLRPKAYLIEAEVTTGTASGTVVGPSIPANCLVLAAGVEFITSPGTATAHTVDVGDGTTAVLNDADVNSAAAGAYFVGNAPFVATAADTIDLIQTVTGAATAATARVWAVVMDIDYATKAAAEVDRDVLA